MHVNEDSGSYTESMMPLFCFCSTGYTTFKFDSYSDLLLKRFEAQNGHKQLNSLIFGELDKSGQVFENITMQRYNATILWRSQIALKNKAASQPVLIPAFHIP